MGLFQEARRAHDLILIARFARLKTGCQQPPGLHVGNRNPGTADRIADDHRTVRDDTDENLGVDRFARQRGHVVESRAPDDGGPYYGDQEQAVSNQAQAPNHTYLTLIPAGTASTKVANPSTSLSPAASTMPCDSMPMSLAGLRFATTIIVFPIKSSGPYFLPMPATICRCSEPRSTCSFSNFSDFGTRSAVNTFAVRKWIFWKSSIVI